MKKNILIVIILFLIISGTITTYLYLKNKNINDTKNIQKDNFTLTYTYKGSNNWEYTVTGKLPTPCYNATTEAMVAESYPEQVSIKVTTKEDTDVQICSTVEKEYTYSGTFSASEKAKTSLIVE